MGSEGEARKSKVEVNKLGDLRDDFQKKERKTLPWLKMTTKAPKAPWETELFYVIDKISINSFVLNSAVPDEMWTL